MISFIFSNPQICNALDIYWMWIVI